MSSKIKEFEEFQDKCIPNYAIRRKENKDFYTFYSNESKINCLMEIANYMILQMDDLNKSRPPRLVAIPAPNNTSSVIICEYIQIGDHLLIRPYHLSLMVITVPGLGESVSYTYIDTEMYYSDTDKDKLNSLPDNIIKRMFVELILSED